MSLFDLLTAFDWISPAHDLIKDATSGASTVLAVSLSCGHSPRDVEKLLRRRGVETWGLTVDQARGCIYVSCRQKQAAWARQVLAHAGIATL